MPAVNYVQQEQGYRVYSQTTAVTVDNKSVRNGAVINKDTAEISVHSQKGADLADKVCFKCGLRGHLRINCKLGA